MHSSLTIYDPRATDILNASFTIETLVDDCRFTEGPVWNAEGYYLFSDIPANLIYRLFPGKPKEVYLQNSGCTLEDRSGLSEQVGSNGLTYDADGNLLICQHGNGAVALWDGREMKVLAGSYQGRRFNSPNDIVVHPDGSVFFSDPPYGLKDAKLGMGQATAAFYCLRDGGIKPFCTDYEYPNGLCLSPDGKLLYLVSNRPSERIIRVYDPVSLEFISVLAEENADGIKCDRAGNLYLCTKEGILVLDPQGRRLALISLPSIPANCCWGGISGSDLFVTAREQVLRISLLVN